ncbi:sigma-70 family RNA polymerase sigma factor [Polyangium mundeleinium]|uniref:Sigma-70 family RNA polymerase sigma factor n=1 Tax=Polyangium mundeleinium TaxID=2995306 RepID=A0ABT5F289_9BACT|nr:sigma-70 family RNA polymerase sigma factor [Polyangium mundeleinium]MDC0748111.1 sigma-70 family RNA polymerase sigma factor [Polyangium mundeleinium]
MGDSIQRTPSRPRHKPRVEVLYELFLAEVRDRLGSLGLQGDDLEELVQIVFTVANRRTAVIPRNDEAARRWLMEVCRKQVSNFRKLYRHAYEVLDPEAVADAVAQPEDPEQYHATIALVQAAARLMPEDEREILLRHDVEGESLHEIAKWLGLKKSGAHVRVKQARARFVEKLALIEAQRRGRRRKRGFALAWFMGLFVELWRWILEKRAQWKRLP